MKMFKKIAASILTAALIVTAPGLDFYRAWAGVGASKPSAKPVSIQAPMIPAARVQTNFSLMQSFLQRLGIAQPVSPAPKNIPAGKVNVSLLQDLQDMAGLSQKTASNLKDSSDSKAKKESDEIFGLHPRTAERQMDAVAASLKDTNTLRPSRTLMDQLSRDVRDVFKDMTAGPRLKTKRQISAELRRKIRDMRKHHLAQYNSYVYAGGMSQVTELSPKLDPALDKIENLVRSVEKSSKGNRQFIEKFFPALERAQARLLSTGKESGAKSSRLSAKEFKRQMGAVLGRLHVVSETNRVNFEQMTQAEVVKSYKAEFSYMRTQVGRPVLRERRVPLNPKAEEFGFRTVVLERLSPKMDRHLMRMEELVQEAYEKFKAEEKEWRQYDRGHPDYSVDELMLDRLNTQIHGRLTDYADNVARSLKALEEKSSPTVGMDQRGFIRLEALLAFSAAALAPVLVLGLGYAVSLAAGMSLAKALIVSGATSLVPGLAMFLATHHMDMKMMGVEFKPKEDAKIGAAFSKALLASGVLSILGSLVYLLGLGWKATTAASTAGASAALAMAPLGMPDNNPQKDPIQEERKILADSLGDVLDPAIQESSSPSSLIKAYLEKAEKFKATELGHINPRWLRSAVAEVLDSVGKALSSLGSTHQDPVQFEQALVRFIQSVGKAMEEGKNVGEIVHKIREAAENPGQISKLEQEKIQIYELLQSLLMQSNVMGLVLSGLQRIPPMVTARLYQELSKRFKESEASSIQPESLRSAAVSIMDSVGFAINYLAKAYPFVTQELQMALIEVLNKTADILEDGKSLEEIESKFAQLAQETEKTPLPSIPAPKDRFSELIPDSIASILAGMRQPLHPELTDPRQLTDDFWIYSEEFIAKIVSRIETQEQRQALTSVIRDLALAMRNMALTSPNMEAFQKASEAFFNELTEKVLKRKLSVEETVQAVKELADRTEPKGQGEKEA